jgi:hypothetical protein
MIRTCRIIRAASVVILGFFLMGMSGAISPGQGTEASPYNAKIKDSANYEMNIASVTFDGKTSLNAYLGKGKVQIPFENISRIEVKDKSVCVILTGAGTMCNLTLNGVSKIYGKTSYGTYQVALKDVILIELTKAKQ